MGFKRVLVLGLIILFIPLFTPSALALPSFNPAQSSKAGDIRDSFTESPVYSGSMPPIPSPDYSDVGTARSTSEYANRTDAGQNLQLFYNSTSGVRTNDTAEAVLPPGWEGYMLYTYIYQIAENRCWVLNPEFNNSAQYWTNITFDGGSHTNTIINYYRPDGHGSGNSAVECFIDGENVGGSWHSYDPVDYARWNQTITVPARGQVISASIRFDYSVWTDSIWGLGLPFQIYARVEGQSVHSVGFDNVQVGEQTWTNTGIQSFSPGIIDLSDGLNVQVGLRYTGGSGTRFSPDPQPHARFDNVFLYIRTLVNPSDINLTMNGHDVVDVDFGIGRVTDNQTGTPWTTTPVVAYINWTSSPFPPDPNMDMDVTLTVDTNLFSRKFSTTLYDQNPSHNGTIFEAMSGQNTSWTMYYQLALPSQYGNDHFNFTIPADWNVTFVSEPQLPTTNKVDQCMGGQLGDGYLSIPASNITNSPDGYWCIKAESHNYVDSVELQIGDGSWSTTTAVRAGNTTRVLARILDGSNNPPADVTLTQANVSIYNPDSVVIWYSQLITPNPAGWVFTDNITIDGSTTIGGIYTIVVFWDNSTEAGERQTTYSVTHATTLVPRDSWIDAFFENQYWYPRVRFNDTDKDTWLTPPATVIGNWTIGTITFHWIEGTGWYEAEINALEAGDVGRFTIRVNASKSYYDDSYCFIIIDIVAETQIHCPQGPTVTVAWGENETIEVRYWRKVDSAGVNGCIPYVEVLANWSVGYYSIFEVGNGWYNIELNSSAEAPGSYALNITLIKERYQQQQFYLTVIVRGRSSLLTPTYIPTADYGGYINVTVTYYDLDGGKIISNSSGYGGHVRIIVYNASHPSNPPLNPSIYNITELFDHTYRILIDTSAFGTVNVFHEFIIIATWDAGFNPYYGNASCSVTIYVIGTKTTVIYTPPEPQPYGDDLIFLIKYNETEFPYDPVDNVTWGSYVRITALCTTHIFTLDYMVEMINNGAGGYHLIIHTTNFPELGQYTFQVNITWLTNIAPFYQSHNLLFSGYVRAVHTSLTWKLPGSLYWGDTLYLLITYRDDDHNIILYDPSNTTVTTWLSWVDWSVLQIFPNGTYQIRVNTASEDVGLRNFTIRFTRDFYENRQQIIQFTVNPLPLYVDLISTSPWNAEYNESVVVTVRVTDEYGRLINDSNTVYHWAGLPDAPMTFIGAGIYNVTFSAGQNVGTYLITVEANKTNCQTGIGILTLYILPVDSSLTILEPTIYVVAGDFFIISVNYTTVYGSALPGANVSYSWAGGSGVLIYVGGGRFNATLNSTGFAFGQKTVYITASHPNVVEHLGLITVIITVKPATLEPESTVINVYWGENFSLLVFFHDTHYDLPINGALVQYQWGPLNGTLQFISAGWYNVSLPSTIFNVGVYQITITASPVGYQYTIASVTINILAQPTQLTLTQAEAHLDAAGFLKELGLTGWIVPRGDVLWLYFNFTDSYNSTIFGATGYYTWKLGSGILEFINNLYIAKINLTDVSPGTYFLTITLSRQNFVVNQKTQMQLVVIPIPTAIEGVDDTISLFTGDSFDITVSFNDTWHVLLIPGAYVTLSIPELGIYDSILNDNGDGTYSIQGLSIPREGTFTIQITAQGAARFDQAQRTIIVFVSLHPFVQYTFQLGLIVALLGIIFLGGWLAWSRIFSIPWLVRKMRKMSRTLGSGKTPSLSGREIDRIATRADSMTVIAESVYDGVGLAVPAAVIPAVLIFEEREAEDEVLWRELEKLEGLGVDQKLELFEEMKRIPPTDRVWFIEDLKRQMADGTRFARQPMPPTEAMEVPPGVEPDLIKRLEAITAMTPEEKAAVIEQLKGIPKKEQEEVIRAIEETKG